MALSEQKQGMLTFLKKGAFKTKKTQKIMLFLLWFSLDVVQATSIKDEWTRLTELRAINTLI